ncbi:MAG: hypothetical protein UT63_C0053G0003 [Candidatus Gottesmanbacteria bacterium GW2011_GWC2_39_8]|uniref:Uncharacterized protein n=1 Tax=Candidatus Gottesmanbacteria bacterium GW2011_GWC2_39_8 TaxID=1618450 RepID=A0A0G0T2I3_9BACT|nr:MAG: hypothetical protein UT63_C0053G0003 [Candidatus Gottesmanbacteria bacterium GW2011_GWC2_39_8]
MFRLLVLVVIVLIVFAVILGLGVTDDPVQLAEIAIGGSIAALFLIALVRFTAPIAGLTGLVLIIVVAGLLYLGYQVKVPTEAQPAIEKIQQVQQKSEEAKIGLDLASGLGQKGQQVLTFAQQFWPGETSSKVITATVTFGQTVCATNGSSANCFNYMNNVRKADKSYSVSYSFGPKGGPMKMTLDQKCLDATTCVQLEVGERKNGSEGRFILRFTDPKNPRDLEMELQTPWKIE